MMESKLHFQSRVMDDRGVCGRQGPKASSILASLPQG